MYYSSAWNRDGMKWNGHSVEPNMLLEIDRGQLQGLC